MTAGVFEAYGTRVSRAPRFTRFLPVVLVPRVTQGSLAIARKLFCAAF